MHETDGIRITVLVENWIDILLGEEEFIGRPGLIHHFNPRNQVVQAENGFSLFIESFAGGKRHCVLFDVGLGPDVVVHNLGALGISPSDVDQIAISHGHLDHHGGLDAVLPLIGHPVPVVIHPDAFLPRYLVMANREVGPYYNRALDQDRLAALGARWVLTRQPVPVGPGLYTTGEIPLETDYEGPPPEGTPMTYGPGLYQLRDGEYVFDRITDEQAIVANIRGEGLAVITGCGHRGMINTIAQARRVVGDLPLALVMGGFHLGFPGTPQERIDRTVDALTELDIKRIIPMHCSGFNCMAQIAERMPDPFLQYTTGMTIEIGDVG